LVSMEMRDFIYMEDKCLNLESENSVLMQWQHSAFEMLFRVDCEKESSL